MEQKNYRSFSSKILLFGEYLVLEGGSSLSLPFSNYFLKKSETPRSKNKLFFKKLNQYILSKEELKDKLDQRFIEDVHQGLNYESNIPVGYGLGSSGALVAAIYDDYFNYKETDILKLKLELGNIESFFHDRSSGIDPLTSYLDRSLLFQNNEIQLVKKIDTSSKFELYDSGLKRNAKDAVKHFKSLIQDQLFKIKLEELKQISESLIQKYVLSENIDLDLKLYSKLQLTLFQDFIPNEVKLDWQKGLDSQAYTMKLCGAGMGGMFLKFKH